MIACDLMQRRFVYVTLDADIDYVAKALAESSLGAVPVVDTNLEPIGIVTRSNLEKARPAIAVDLGPIPPFLLRNRPKAPFLGKSRALSEIMTAPPIFVPCDARLAEVERIMAEHRLKRMPVVEGRKLVGLLLRRAVLEAIARAGGDATAADRPTITMPQPEPASCDIVTASEFRELVAAHEHEIANERIEQRRAAAALREQRIRDLAARRLTDAQWREMLSQARAAAAGGLTEHILIRFPSQLCADGGRAINAPDSRWPETLRGEPSDVFRRWRNELHPRGFKIAAQVIDFPDGLPGDAALFLIWGKGG
ncbi:CBS domain-containing protein [Methylocystis sp. IM3]|uniref:CBS domain-containing protein n=1 Tax=unclassified Methylocystis TaxID=2625913 RepID=UPI0030F4E49B